jgi:peptidyl-prolyl cis-trans isomerase D
MAVIGTIRNRMGVVLVIFVGLALVLFILEGLLSSTGSIFSSSSRDVAKIGGTGVSVQEYEARVEQIAEMYKQRNNTEAIDNNTMDQIREQAWTQMVNDMVFGKEYEALGIDVSSDELFDMVQGKNIHPQIRQTFVDKNGQFNPANVIGFLKNLESADEKTRNQWYQFEKGLREERIGQKYNTLVSNAVYATTFQAKQEFIAKNSQAKISYVLLNYNSIPDSTVKISDGEIEDYYAEHKNEYKQENSRKLQYVVFDVEPSAEDRKEVGDEFQKLSEEFKTTKDDSSFVARNSDVPFTDTYQKKGSLAPALDSVMFAASVGQTVGPYVENNTYKMAKLLEVKNLPDSVKARHILLKVEKAEDKDKIMARADSIKKAIKGGKKFEELAKQYSVDQGSAEKGGDLGWFTEGAMVKPFNDACFTGNKGDMPIVQSQFGIHLIEILDQKNTSKRVKVAILERKVEPSTPTYQGLYAKANEIASKLNAGDDFDKVISAKGLAKRESEVKESDRTLSAIESSREIVRWAYRSKQGESSKVFEVGDKFVVAKLTEIKEKGIASFDQIKDQLKPLAIKDKKAKEMIEKIKGTDLNSIAASNKTTVQTADFVTFASAGIAGVGREPIVVGNVFALKKGGVSKAIKGNSGIFVVRVESITEQPLPKDFKAEKEQLLASFKQRAGYEIYNVLKDKAEIQDNRIRFY